MFNFLRKTLLNLEFYIHPKYQSVQILKMFKMLTATIVHLFLAFSWRILTKVGRKPIIKSLWHSRIYRYYLGVWISSKLIAFDHVTLGMEKIRILWDFYILGKRFYIICDFFFFFVNRCVINWSYSEFFCFGFWSRRKNERWLDCSGWSKYEAD